MINSPRDKQAETSVMPSGVDQAETSVVPSGVDPTRQPASGLARRIASGFLEYPQLGLIAAIVIFGLFIETQNSAFLSRANVIEILQSGVYVFIIGVAAVFVLVAGGLDLSVGSLLALGGIVSGETLIHGWGVFPAILAGCAVGALAGAINGYVTTYFKIPALITTLGMLYVAGGLVVVISGGQALLPFSATFDAIGENTVLGVPLLVIYGAVIGIVGHCVLSYTVFGAHVRATGGNRAAAAATGVRVNRISMIVYTVSGLTAAFAGVLLASQLASAQPSVGTTTELEVIAAVIIGGTSLFGGIGTVGGTFLGALLLSMITDGLVLLSLNPAYQNVVVGVVIVAAVGLDRLRRTRMWTRAKPH
jgi:ribose/xylose/arabinose/galactoside ABC-type transport system permease subunit